MNPSYRTFYRKCAKARALDLLLTRWGGGFCVHVSDALCSGRMAFRSCLCCFILFLLEVSSPTPPALGILRVPCVNPLGQHDEASVFLLNERGPGRVHASLAL